MTNEIQALTGVVELSSAGGFGLPAELSQAYAAFLGLQRLEVPSVREPDERVLAGRLVDKYRDGDEVDLLEAARPVLDAYERRVLVDHAVRIRNLAVYQAGHAATAAAIVLADTIIRDYLRPALTDVLAHAGTCSDALSGQLLDQLSLLTAPSETRTAYQDLLALAERRSAILRARYLLDTLTGATPTHDTSGLYRLFRRPTAFQPGWSRPMRLQLPTMPTDPAPLMLWLGSPRAQAAQPWLPTVAEQDAAWLEQFGEQEADA